MCESRTSGETCETKLDDTDRVVVREMVVDADMLAPEEVNHLKFTLETSVIFKQKKQPRFLVFKNLGLKLFTHNFSYNKKNLVYSMFEFFVFF